MPAAIPTIVDGVLYASGIEAARARGVSSQTLYAARERGTLDNVGCGRGKGGGRPGKPVSWRGKAFPSIKACADHLGRRYSTVRERVKSGTLDRLEKRR